MSLTFYLQNCWMTAVRVLAIELAQLQATWPPHMNTEDIRAEIGTLLYALNKLGGRFPLFGQHALPHPRLSAL
jgi:hypothetical protein